MRVIPRDIGAGVADGPSSMVKDFLGGASSDKLSDFLWAALPEFRRPP